MMMKTMRMAQKIFFKKYLAAVSRVLIRLPPTNNLFKFKATKEKFWCKLSFIAIRRPIDVLQDSGQFNHVSSIKHHFLVAMVSDTLHTGVHQQNSASSCLVFVSQAKRLTAVAIPFFFNQLLHYPAIVAFSSVCRRTLRTVPRQNASVEPAVLIWYKSVFVQLWSSPTINHTCDEIGVTDVQSRAETVVAKAKEIVSLDSEVDPTR